MTVTLTPEGQQELVTRCHWIKRLAKLATGSAAVICVRPKDGAHLIKFPGCSKHFSVNSTSIATRSHAK